MSLCLGASGLPGALGAQTGATPHRCGGPELTEWWEESLPSLGNPFMPPCSTKARCCWLGWGLPRAPPPPYPFGIPPPWHGHGSRRNSLDRETGQSLLCHGTQALRLLFLHQALALALLPALPAQRPPGRGDALPCVCPYVVAVPCHGGHVPQAWYGLGSWHRAEGPPAGSACVRRGCCACPFQLGPTLAG